MTHATAASSGRRPSRSRPGTHRGARTDEGFPSAAREGGAVVAASLPRAITCVARRPHRRPRPVGAGATAERHPVGRHVRRQTAWSLPRTTTWILRPSTTANGWTRHPRRHPRPGAPEFGIRPWRIELSAPRTKALNPSASATQIGFEVAAPPNGENPDQPNPARLSYSALWGPHHHHYPGGVDRIRRFRREEAAERHRSRPHARARSMVRVALAVVAAHEHVDARPVSERDGVRPALTAERRVIAPGSVAERVRAWIAPSPPRTTTVVTLLPETALTPDITPPPRLFHGVPRRRSRRPERAVGAADQHGRQTGQRRRGPADDGSKPPSVAAEAGAERAGSRGRRARRWSCRPRRRGRRRTRR